MNTRVRNKLVQLAKTGESPISYRRLINQADLGLNMDIKHEKQLLGEILDEISEEEHEEGRPLLSAMIQDKKAGQGDRFFKLCESLGMGDWRELKKDEAFRDNEVKKCHNFWSEDANYSKFF